MPITLNKGMKIGKKFGKSGHETCWAFVDDYNEDSNQPNNAVEINSKNSNAIYKANKHGNPGLSDLEVGISAVWEASLPELTPQYDLVVDDKNETTGVLSKKLNNFIPMSDEPTAIAGLKSDQKKELAHILVMCYCLEEDDLHRNNIGTAQGSDGNPHVVKIDHDMSFYQSISSVSGNRRGYLRINDEHRFIVSQQDIRGFPVLTSSNIHYWPTKSRLLEGSPGYKNKALRDQFEVLKYNPDFRDATFAAFFHFINVKPEHVREKIEERLGENKPEITSMIVNAFVARQAEVRCTLLAMPEAREYIKNHSECHPVMGPDNQKISLIEGDTALHIALRTNCFHFLDLGIHTNEINTANNNKVTPLMLAIQLNNIAAMESLLRQGARLSTKELRILSRDTNQINNPEIKQLLARNDMKLLLSERSILPLNPIALTALALTAEKSAMTTISESINTYNRVTREKRDSEINIDQSANIIKTITDALEKIRDNQTMSLRQKKEAAAQCIHFIIDNKEIKPNDLKGMLELVEKPQFQFIRQLTSDFWLLRQLRGSHGVTSTYITIHKEIRAAATKQLDKKNLDKDERDTLKTVKKMSIEYESKSKLDSVASLFTHTHKPADSKTATKQKMKEGDSSESSKIH